jgi:hypothetical protein
MLDGLLQDTLGRAVLELDDVVARDELGGPGLDHGRREPKGQEEGSPSEELHGGSGLRGELSWIQMSDDEDSGLCVLSQPTPGSPELSPYLSPLGETASCCAMFIDLPLRE